MNNNNNDINNNNVSCVTTSFTMYMDSQEFSRMVNEFVKLGVTQGTDKFCKKLAFLWNSFLNLIF